MATKLFRLVPRSGRFWGCSFTAWLLFLTYLSSMPGKDKPPSWTFFGIPFDIPHMDKVVHFGFFFGGAGLLAAALRYGKDWPWKKLLLWVPIILALIGLYDEFHQSFVPKRSGNSPGDLAADTLGAIVGAYVFRWTEVKFLRPARLSHK